MYTIKEEKEQMIDFQTILEILIPTVATGVGGYFFGRRQTNANAAQTEVQNFDAAIEAYKKLYENREDIYRMQIKELKEENVALKNEINDLRKQILTVSNFVTAYMIKDKSVTLEDLSKLTDQAQ